jgi:hypothetical protein
MKGTRGRKALLWLGTALSLAPGAWTAGAAPADDATPPAQPIKLVFIHHSTGENWLADGNGGLGAALGRNNYFVSDTNYGWGPDGIGDRTDIPDWPRWFAGPASGRYLRALFSESARRSPFTRGLKDPGGENRIVLFKSCFPTSNLEGRPTDPPAPGEGLTVGNAKAAYNALLPSFAARPDKLFVAITAPPLRDRTHAANARAFNNWLVTEWLSRYAGANVAVFDLYNVLTDPSNHHWFHGGKVEHVIQSARNTLFYPSNGDDHPSPAGNRKATAEFVPLLNVYYHRWRAAGHAQPPQGPQSPPSSSALAPPPLEPAGAASPPPLPASGPPARAQGVVDDFEGSEPAWQAFLDGRGTRLSFVRDTRRRRSGGASLHITYDVAPSGWATCSLVHGGPVDWRGAKGLSLHLHAPRIGQELAVVAYQGVSARALSHFEFRMTTGPEAVAGWQHVVIPWDRLTRPRWEGDGEAPYDPGSSMGVALVFEGGDGKRNRGELWVDDVTLLGGQ